MEWTDAGTLISALGISRATFYRRVQSGEVEAVEIGGVRRYRATIAGPPSQAGSVSRDNVSHSETDKTAVLALVERYETRIDALLQARIEAERAATEARERAAALSAEVERARLELEHARKLAELEIGNLEALARSKLADAERIAREERQRREGAEAQLAAARALESLPWWRFGQRRQVRALLAGMVLGVLSCAPATPPSRYDDCTNATNDLINATLADPALNYTQIPIGSNIAPSPRHGLIRAHMVYLCLSGVDVTPLNIVDAFTFQGADMAASYRLASIQVDTELSGSVDTELSGSVDTELSGSVDTRLSGSVGRY